LTLGAVQHGQPYGNESTGYYVLLSGSAEHPVSRQPRELAPRFTPCKVPVGRDPDPEICGSVARAVPQGLAVIG
jgi:hypothetical protein